MNQRAQNLLVACYTQDPGFFAVGPFESSSGTIVPFYFEFRKLYSDPKAVRRLANHTAQAIKKMRPQVVAGAADAGIPLAMAISLKTNIPFVYIKKQRKAFLAKTAVEGSFPPGARAVLIDDTLLYGNTKKCLIDNARKDGRRVTDVLVIYESGGRGYQQSAARAWLKRQRITTHFIFRKEEMITFLMKRRLVPPQTLLINDRYAENPKTWVNNGHYWQDFLTWKKDYAALRSAR